MTMEGIQRAATEFSPQINFDPGSGILDIRGRSIPEHPNRFFGPLLEWTEQYVQSAPTATTLSIFMDYLNSSSQKYLLEILSRLRPLAQQQVLTVKWLYEEDDEEILRTGEDLQVYSEMTFEFVPMPELSLR